MLGWQFLDAFASWVRTRFDVRGDRGATGVEYAVLVALIAAVVILAVYFLGHATSASFECAARPRGCNP